MKKKGKTKRRVWRLSRGGTWLVAEKRKKKGENREGRTAGKNRVKEKPRGWRMKRNRGKRKGKKGGASSEAKEKERERLKGKNGKFSG